MSGAPMLNNTTMTEQHNNTPVRDGHHPGVRQPRHDQHGHRQPPPPGHRRRRVMIEQEIDLYCNPFVEVYLRMSKHLRRKCRKMLLDLTDVVLEFQDNVIFRNIFVVANYTLC